LLFDLEMAQSAQLDLSQQLRLNPDAAVGNALGVGLRLPYQRRQPIPKHLRAFGVKAVIDLTGKTRSLPLRRPM
jgi:hypothetical protein